MRNRLDASFPGKKRDKRNGYRGAVFTVFLLFFLFVALVSCEQFFTSSPLEWAQRDPSNLPKDQRISYAELALGSGDTEKLRDAYEAIKDIDEPEVQYLASQVAMGASGLTETLTDALNSDDELDSSEILDGIDGEWLDNAETSMAAADAGNADISSEDYVTIAAAMVIKDAKDNGGNFSGDLENELDPANADKDGDNLSKAAYYLDESGYSANDMDSLMGLAGA